MEGKPLFPGGLPRVGGQGSHRGALVPHAGLLCGEGPDGAVQGDADTDEDQRSDWGEARDCSFDEAEGAEATRPDEDEDEDEEMGQPNIWNGQERRRWEIGDGRWVEARRDEFVAGESWYAAAQGVASGGGWFGGGAGERWLSRGQGDVFGRGAEDCGLAAGGGTGRTGDGVAPFSGGGTAWLGRRAGIVGDSPWKRRLAPRGGEMDRVWGADRDSRGDDGTDFEDGGRGRQRLR